MTAAVPDPVDPQPTDRDYVRAQLVVMASESYLRWGDEEDEIELSAGKLILKILPWLEARESALADSLRQAREALTRLTDENRWLIKDRSDNDKAQVASRRSICELSDRYKAERDAAREALTAAQRKLDQPCGSCHPCVNYSGSKERNDSLMRSLEVVEAARLTDVQDALNEAADEIAADRAAKPPTSEQWDSGNRFAESLVRARASAIGNQP